MCENKVGYPHFDVGREDDCIYLRDYRGSSPVEIHMIPEQAYEIALKLLKVVEAK